MIREKRARLNGRAALLIAVLATMTIVAPAQAQSGRAACLARHYAAYARAQRDYQRAVERLVVREDGTLRPLAAMARAEQIARIDARQRAVETLLATSPGTVHVDRATNEWLDWGPAEARRLSSTDTVFARLDSLARSTAALTRDHPSWPRLRRAMQRSFPSAEHRAALARLDATLHAPPRCA
ncbi:MAG TPA: hypothetical protein VJT85_01940 [Gemmatimonadaceae bacterium]|nr:hypothetical protein [Gemmatimonadaceae bacterium]